MYQVAVKFRKMAKSKKAPEPQANELENGEPENDEPQAYDLENDEQGNGKSQAYKSDKGGLSSSSEIGCRSSENRDYLMSSPPPSFYHIGELSPPTPDQVEYVSNSDSHFDSDSDANANADNDGNLSPPAPD